MLFNSLLASLRLGGQMRLTASSIRIGAPMSTYIAETTALVLSALHPDASQSTLLNPLVASLHQ